MESQEQQDLKGYEVLEGLNSFYDSYARTPFILSFDGGGIYALTEAIWLRQLCEQVPGFLTPRQVRIFAGTSAGAVNALLLARHESPREAVLAGELERFWTKTGILSNEENFVTRWTGTLMTAMYGDALGALHDVFGDMTLKDLADEGRNRVLISTFNYTGRGPKEKRDHRTPFDGPGIDWSAFRPKHMFNLGTPEAI